MLIRKLRLQKGWSQQQLAELAGLSVRTIQRVERGHKPGLETVTALASVFEVELSTLSTLSTGDTSMNNTVKIEKDEQDAIQFVKGIKEFYSHVIMFMIFAVAFLVFKSVSEPLILWGLLGWGIGVIIHGLVAFEKINFIGPGWEKKQVEKRLGRDL